MISSPGTTQADDRILPITRVIAALLVPFLVVAFGILYLWPDQTGQLFAWAIHPTMSALLMGAGYIAGAYFFVRALFAKRWHHIAVGFLPVTSFATLLMLTTLLHWERFNHGQLAFLIWVALYATSPFLVLALWLLNRRSDPGTPDADDVMMPVRVRLIMAGVGALLFLTGALLFLRPALFIPLWPWLLTIPTARALGAWFVLPGVFGLTMARDSRWSAARLALQSQLLGILLILGGVLRAWADFDPHNLLFWLFIGGMSSLAVGIALLSFSMERQRHRVA